MNEALGLYSSGPTIGSSLTGLIPALDFMSASRLYPDHAGTRGRHRLRELEGRILPTCKERGDGCEARPLSVPTLHCHVATTIGRMNGQFELNVFKPLVICIVLYSVRLLADASRSFERDLVAGLTANEDKIASVMRESLMLVPCLIPRIGYDAASRVAENVHEKGLRLRESAVELGVVSEEEIERLERPELMVGVEMYKPRAEFIG
ncbi:hypothetical protein V502_04397 [Pseudogymnoascus sp. VKM F-4520 (FW-2644)]|nr:hypothetical protein V502_04397 [Pseudogymnoascus sp. VKM F-4520 (FW-2644)]